MIHTISAQRQCQCPIIWPHWSVLATGSPYCTQSRVALDCRVADIREVGTHSVIFAEVLSTVHASDGQPLIYHSRNYATIRHVA